MENRKLRVGLLANSALIKTGLSRNTKALLTKLFKTNKYELFLLNQSMGDNDPNYARFPWHNEGCMKNFDQNRFNQDPNYQRYVSYGNAAIGDWVVRNKLDVVITYDDIWAYDLDTYLKSDWYNHIKDNFIFDITIDSLPIMNQAKELARGCPNFRVWSGFAERTLKQENENLYRHVKVMRGAIDIEQFKPLEAKEIAELRHKFGISDNEKIIFYLGRNQLRKNSFHANQEALKLWKEKYSDRKIRLLFHTKFSEPNGWPIDSIREELKLDKEDILSTYFCRKCGEWNIQPYHGEDLDCKCGAAKGRVTAGIDSPIDEHDLNKIYNLADACCSSFTSGGQEYNLVESMLAGLPLACPFYSSGEDFILSGLVQEIKGSFYREFNTSFKKFNPNIHSIFDFYEYIWNLKPEDREVLIKNAREWAIKEFSADSISKQIEEFIDSRNPIDWEIFLSKQKEIKNINAQVEYKENDEEFISECYLKILNMNPAPDDSGRVHWRSYLNQNGDKRKLKEQMANIFRSEGFKHNQKVNPINPVEQAIIKNGKKNFLIVCPESAGDICIASSTLQSFRECYIKEEWNIYFACKPEFMELLDCNPHIDAIIQYLPFMDNEIQCIGRGKEMGLFQGYNYISAQSQRFLNYLGNDKINLNLTK